MTVPTTFLDAFSWFAVLALWTVVAGSAIWLTADQVGKRQALKRVEAGLRELSKAKDKLATLEMREEVFLVGVMYAMTRQTSRKCGERS